MRPKYAARLVNATHECTDMCATESIVKNIAMMILLVLIGLVACPATLAKRVSDVFSLGVTQEDVESRYVFGEQWERFSEGCSKSQKALRDSRVMWQCDWRGEAEACSAWDQETKALEEEADAQIWGAVNARKDLARSLRPSLLKSFIMGTAFATHAKWYCVLESLDYDSQMTFELYPTWD